MIDPFDAIMQHYNQGQFAQAKALLERELVARPKDAQVHGFMSIVLLHLGENAQAAEHAQHSSRLAPRSSDAWTWLGNANAALLRQAEA